MYHDLPDDPGDRDMRRLQLAKRLVQHRARTQTIFGFTGISRHQLATLRLRWRVTQTMRHRGPSPTSFAVFFRSPLARSEGTAAAVIFALFVPPAHLHAHAHGPQFAELAAGECLCEVFEAFQACFPASELEFEHLVLLIRGIAKRESIGLQACSRCSNATLIDRLATTQQPCGPCERLAALA